MRKYIDENVLAFFNGDEEKFQAWLNTPNPMLGDITPMKTDITKLYNWVKQTVQENAAADKASGNDCMGCQ